MRRQILDGEGAKNLDFIEDTVHHLVAGVVEKQSPEASGAGGWKLDELAHLLSAEFMTKVDLSAIKPEATTVGDVANAVVRQILDAYKAKSDLIGQANMAKIESFVLLQIIDRAWKNHLLAMDALKDSVSLRGYGQRDPLQEYKKEAYRLFESLIGRIHDETTMALVTMEPPRIEQVPQLQAQEVDERKLNFQHQEPQQFERPQPPAPAQQAGAQQAPSRQSARQPEENLIYHGSRSAPPPQQAAQRPPTPQTVRRDQPKVGRNDPCPCGSGKKYKKCHGAEAGEDARAP
jgi:preprotein translocase subunit SecA